MVSAEQMLHEVAYTLQTDSGPETGRLDALFRQNSLRTIVEFKTDKLRDDLERDQLLVQKDYLAQAARGFLAVIRK